MSTLVASAGDYCVESWRKADADAFRLLHGGEPLRWSSIPRALVDRPEVRSILSEALRGSEHDAFFWECTPWRQEADPLFEFVLVDAPAFSRMTASPHAFSAHFDEGLVASFDSLRKDARLVAPCPAGRRDVMLHLASFVRHADAERIDALWIAVGREIAAWRRADRGTLWLSTSGLGVPWLHIRLDSRPKYYVHSDYR